MDEERPRKRRTTNFIRSARTKRILERLREGFGYGEIAGQEKLTERRDRQIVTEALESREALESAVHAHMPVERLGQAVRVAGEALSRGDLGAVAPFIKAFGTLDRYQSLARETAPPRPKTTNGDALLMKMVVARIRAGSRGVQERSGSGRGGRRAAPGSRPGVGRGSRRRAAARHRASARSASPGSPSAGGGGSRRRVAGPAVGAAPEPIGDVGELIRRETRAPTPDSPLSHW